MKLFSVSCKMNRENRAVEIAHRSINSKIVQGLCNYAAKIQRPVLSEKVAAIGRERLQAIENEKNKEDERAKFKRKIHPSLPSSSSIINEIRSPIIAPSKILVAKRKTPSSLFTSTTSNSSVNIVKDIGKTRVINENVEPIENLNDGFTVFETNGKEHNDQIIENSSIPSDGEDDEQGELNTSIASSALGSALLSDSFLLDSSPANNPFKAIIKD